MKKKLLPIIALCLISISISALATILLTKTVVTNFYLKTSTGLEVDDYTTGLEIHTLPDFAFDTQGQIINLNETLKNTANHAENVTYHISGIYYNQTEHVYDNGDFDISLQYYSPDHHEWRSSEDSASTPLTIPQGGTVRIYFGSKCYTDSADPAHMLSGITVSFDVIS
jgi:hypothetical protein